MMRIPQFNLKFLMLAVFVSAVLIWIALTTIDRTRNNIEASRSEYAAQVVAYMCVEHLRSNNISWPKDWGELNDDFEVGLKNSGQKWKWEFSDLKNRIDVNWFADLDQLRNDPSFSPIIWIANEPERKCYMTSPNEIVLSYLSSTQAIEK